MRTDANDTCSEMAGRRVCQSGSAKPTQTQERTTLSPAQVERAVDAIQYLSTIGRSTTNGDRTTPTTSCSGSNGASDGSSALSQVESGSGTEASGKC